MSSNNATNQGSGSNNQPPKMIIKPQNIISSNFGLGAIKPTPTIVTNQPQPSKIIQNQKAIVSNQRSLGQNQTNTPNNNSN